MHPNISTSRILNKSALLYFLLNLSKKTCTLTVSLSLHVSIVEGSRYNDGMWYKLIDREEGTTLEDHRETCLNIPGYRLAQIRSKETCDVILKDIHQGRCERQKKRVIFYHMYLITS